MDPFERRKILIVYSATLFAVVGPLTGVMPAAGQTPAPNVARRLRRGMLAAAALALLVSPYALAAVIYRTRVGAWTPNWQTSIGCNRINLALLGARLLGPARAGDAEWPRAQRASLSKDRVLYVLWVIWAIVVVPLIF